MSTKQVCKSNGCQARAWQAELCNFHALQQHRQGRPEPLLSSADAAAARATHQARAEELGIKLAEPESVVAVAPSGNGRKVRSPVS